MELPLFVRKDNNLAYKNKADRAACSLRYYLKNKAAYAKRNKERKIKLKAWFLEYKKTLSCEKCKLSDHRCLEFHHIDPKIKDDEISSMIAKGMLPERILEEIKKCMVLCANCHRIEHYVSK